MKANELTKQILEYCKLKGHYVYRVNNIPATKYRANTLTKGIADIQGCTKHGQALAIEVKTTDNQSVDQIKFEKQYKKRGGIYILARKLEDVSDLI